MADKNINLSLFKKGENLKESSASASKDLNNMQNTTIFSQTTGNAEVFFKYVRDTIEQIEDEIKSTQRSEALRLIRKLKSQIDTLESRLNSLPNNISLFSNLDDIVLSSRMNFQPELRARIQRLRKELEELKKKSSKLKARISSRNNMLTDNTLDPSPLPFIDMLTRDSREDAQENEESQKALDEIDSLFEEKEQTSQANEEFSEKPALADELKGKEESKDQNIDRGIIDTLNEIESTLEEIGQVFEINEKTQSHIDFPDEFKAKEEAKIQTTDSEIIGTIDFFQNLNFKLKIVNTCNQVKSESKTFSTISVPIT